MIDLQLNSTAIYMVQPTATSKSGRMVQISLDLDRACVLDDTIRSAWQEVAPEVQELIGLAVSVDGPKAKRAKAHGSGYDLELEVQPWTYGKRWRFKWGDQEVPSGEKWVFTWSPWVDA